MPQKVIRIGHSPDADDAFMFYALTQGKIATDGLEIQHELQDIQTLNQRCLGGDLEVSAVSVHAYAYLTDKYLLLPSGFSMGDRYGPIVVGRSSMSKHDLERATIAVPGVLTTAFLLLKLYLGVRYSYRVMPFDQILQAVQEGIVEAGLVIHEGQLTYPQQGLYLVADLGRWWFEQTGLPLPLGANVVRRDLGDEVIGQIVRLLRESIEYALKHPEEALDYALQFGRGLSREQGRQFVQMYVNQRTLRAGPVERQAVERLLSDAYSAGFIPYLPRIDFAQEPNR
ncbi:MAG: ABC transporter substrate-binding protein [Gemmatales bacterium]|nr:ABC transporter substrate-binding protein [Gemmatales bacterium]MDW8221388.1 MqnA/MqnD/SBP family protein [Gemmatales bacterium]